MAGTASRGLGIWGLTVESTSSQRCEYGELVAETESTLDEKLEDELPSTSDDDDLVFKPSDLYGKFTWKISKFSQIKKREVRSSTFEVGGYKWYILIYPQGCDACHHLSLFLCVADHDKLLPGWSHSALFTISAVSKDPKKAKYSDTLHRFWKKEHDWGWKKFMELPKLLDDFFENDTLIIKAQVQVIRESANCSFRSLDRQYKRELARVYISQVEQIFRRFVGEKREKLLKLTDNEDRWTGFCSFWKHIDKNTRNWMSSENKDIILRRAVKQFFVENEVTSILVMDSLYFGLKALEGRYIYSKGIGRTTLFDETQAPIVCAEKEVFVLTDDVVPVIERVARKPLHPENKKAPQQLRTKDGGPGDDSCNKVNDQNEMRLAELGRQTLEIYILDHIFSNRVEIAYQEAVSFQMQEDLIREEAEYEKVRKRSVGNDKKSKKKQAKQKQSSKKENKKTRDAKHVKTMSINADIADDVEDCAAEVVLPPPEQREASEDLCDMEDLSSSSNSSTIILHSEPVPILRGTGEKRSSKIDDCSSTCSTDSISSAILNSDVDRYPQFKLTYPRKKNQKHNRTIDDNRLNGLKSFQLTEPGFDNGHQNDEPVGSKVGSKEASKQATSFEAERNLSEQHTPAKDVQSPANKKSVKKSTAAPQCPVNPLECAHESTSTESSSQTDGDTNTNTVHRRSLCTDVPNIQPVPLIAMPTGSVVHKPESQQGASQNQIAKRNLQGPSSSKPLGTRVVPGSSPSVQLASASAVVQTSFETGSLSARSFAPLSYKSAVTQNEEGSRPSSSIGVPRSYASVPTSAPSTTFYLDTVQSNRVSSELCPGKSAAGALNTENQWMNPSNGYMGLDLSSMANDIQQLSLGSYWHSKSMESQNGSSEFVRAGCTQSDEFPHLDLINYLLDEELNTQNVTGLDTTLHNRQNGRFPYPGEFAETNNSFRSQETGFNNNHAFRVSYNYDIPLPMNDNMMLQGDSRNFVLDSSGILPQISYCLPPIHPNTSVSSDFYQVYRHGN